LIDRTMQYFLAGAIREGTSENEYVVNTATWFGCTSVLTPGGLCEACR